jgi:cytochrome b561
MKSLKYRLPKAWQLVVTLRFLWRLGNVLPHLVENLPDWQHPALCRAIPD